jgi:TPR repeat protein
VYLGAHEINGIKRNYTRARLYFEKAAKVTGLDVSTDLELQWDTGRKFAAGERNQPEGSESITLMEDEYVEVEDQGMDEPSMDALLTLGDFVSGGFGGVPRNATKSLQLYELAASLGSVPAHPILAEMHWSGSFNVLKGTSSIFRSDCQSALRYAKVAAYTTTVVDDFVTSAFESLTSEDAPNATLALDLYRRLANMGSLSAISNLAFLFHRGWSEGLGGAHLIDQNLTEALFWARVAAELGERHNWVRLGDFSYYETLASGVGRVRNTTQAYEFYSRAGELNDSRALFNVASGKLLGEVPAHIPGNPRQLLDRAWEWDPNAWLAIGPWRAWAALQEWEWTVPTISADASLAGLVVAICVLAVVRHHLRHG